MTTTYANLSAVAGRVADAILATQADPDGSCFLAAAAVRELLPELEVVRVVGRLFSQPHEWAAIVDNEDNELIHIDANYGTMGGYGVLVVREELPTCYAQEWNVEEWDRDGLETEFTDDLAAIVNAAR